jgi:hypothetical protein
MKNGPEIDAMKAFRENRNAFSWYITCGSTNIKVPPQSSIPALDTFEYIILHLRTEWSERNSLIPN